MCAIWVYQNGSKNFAVVYNVFRGNAILHQTLSGVSHVYRLTRTNTDAKWLLIQEWKVVESSNLMGIRVNGCQSQVKSQSR